jgi:outer membrane protein OmpA-like peptidoglycan-associated protein/opacity protein-like surface antigen
LCLGTAAYAQDASQTNQTNQKTAKTSTGDEYPDIIELTVFGGVSLYGAVVRGLDTKLVDGGLVGGAVTWNASRRVGLELWGDYDVANVEFKSPSAPGLPTYSFGSRNWFIGGDLIFNLKPRGSRVVPYLMVGADAVQFTPTSKAENIARSPAVDAVFHSANLNDNLQVGLNYGGGVKFHITDHFGVRVEGRGLWSRNPTYGLPNFPDGGIYIPAKDKINGFQGTIGLVWFAGQVPCDRFPMPPAPQPYPPINQGAITGTEGATICQGKPVALHSTASTPASGHKLAYAWKVNGQPAGSDSPDFTFTPNNTGSFNIEVTVTDTTPPPPVPEKPKKMPERCWTPPTPPPPPAPATATTTVTVNETAPEITNVAANPNTVICAQREGPHTAALSATANPSACGGNLSYKWTVTEGSVTNDTSANATFDASTVTFESGAQNQTKTVTATVTVTDESGKTASKTTDITVNCPPPPFQRLDDVIFAKNNARVNNCDKRLLIDQAATQMGDQYDIVLVGHRDSDERENVVVPVRRGRRRAERRALDEQRTLNCAAVLSGGTGTCGKVDSSRIKVDWVGTDQTSETRPASCGTSNIKERKGSRVTDADKNRRVEVYLVPRNSQAMPPAVKNVKPLPESEVKALGCPR